MVIIGLLLLIAGAVVLVDMGASSSGSVDVHLLGWHLGVMGPGRTLLVGTAIGVVLTLGLVCVLSSLRRSRRRRRESARTIAGTRAENKRLAAQLEERQGLEARTADAAGPATAAAAAHDVVSTGNVDAYPTEPYPAGAEYVLRGTFVPDPVESDQSQR